MICPELHCTGRHSSGSSPPGTQLCPRARRLKTATDRRSKRHRRGLDTYDEIENEVKVVEGRCVTWNCYNSAPDGPECAEHAAEPLPKLPPRSQVAKERLRKRYREDPEYRKAENARKRDEKRRARLDPAHREREARLKREKTAARRAAAGYEGTANLATARKERRHATILERLRKDGFVSSSEIAREFGVRTERIAEDLRHFESQGLAVKVYGGARLPEATSNQEAAA